VRNFLGYAAGAYLLNLNFSEFSTGVTRSVQSCSVDSPICLVFCFGAKF